MNFIETGLNNACIIELDELEDERGFFARTYCLKEFEQHGIEFPIAQANVSFNHYKQTLRGLHYQRKPYGEDKLVRCTRGSIFDVIIDVRPESPTYLDWLGVELSEKNYKMLYVPKGFAHGFITLEDKTEIIYQMSEFYEPGAGQGIRWDDAAFAIEWPVKPKIISQKDQNWPDFEAKKDTQI